MTYGRNNYKQQWRWEGSAFQRLVLIFGSVAGGKPAVYGKTLVGARLHVVPLDCFENWKGQTVRLSAGFTLCREDRQFGVFGRGDMVSLEQEVSE